MRSVPTYTYELLCVDSSNSSKILNTDQLGYSLMSNGELWNSVQFHQELHRRISSNDLEVILKSVATDNAPGFIPQKAFQIIAMGTYDRLEKIRLPLITHIQKQEINLVYVLADEISEYIACEIYPKINRVENRLRRYLIKFFVTKLGIDWWKLTADADMKQKAQQRQNNEMVFSKHIDNKVYLIDFGELGKIVYAQSSGFLSKEDIISRVMKLEHSVDAIVALQNDLQSNYAKFFNETFKNRGFQSKWEELQKIRHKVAHNNLFTQDDLEKANELASDLLSIIEDADKKINEVVFSTGEKEAIQEAIDNLLQLEDGVHISEEVLLQELELQEKFFERRGGYVGLAHFVKTYLGGKGYVHATSYNLVKSLAERNIIEIYTEERSPGYSAQAIRKIKSTGEQEDSTDTLSVSEEMY